MVARRRRVAVLISGRGSNMRALVEVAARPDYPAEIVLVAANDPSCEGLVWAKSRGIAVAGIDHRIYASREAFERSLQITLDIHRVELICLAGFMRLLTPWFVNQWTGRLVNIHPALLPSYRGLHTHARALADGAKIHGCTVHHVVAEMDAGPIIAQAAVPVRGDDTPETLGARVLQQEHVLYPHALWLLTAKDGAAPTHHDEVNAALVSPPLASARLGSGSDSPITTASPARRTTESGRITKA